MQIYADNAATTRISQTAMDAMVHCMQQIWGNPSSLHAVGQRAGQELMKARNRMAALLGCRRSEVTFTSGGTESDNQALRTGAAAGLRNGKRHILSTAFEHHAVLHTLEALAGEGFEVTLLDIPETGIIDPDEFYSEGWLQVYRV